MAILSEYELEPLREGADFTLYRGKERESQMPILAVAIAAEQPPPHSLRRLEHEYSLQQNSTKHGQLDRSRWLVTKDEWSSFSRIQVVNPSIG